jgi:hypothetical protein
MTSIFTILSNSYAAGPPALTKGSLVPVDPTLYTGNWSGTYSNGEKFSFQISNVQGFRAKVRLQNGNGPVQFQDVLIRGSAFRIGDTKFQLVKPGQAQVGTVVTNAATGNSDLLKGSATLD